MAGREPGDEDEERKNVCSHVDCADTYLAKTPTPADEETGDGPTGGAVESVAGGGGVSGREPGGVDGGEGGGDGGGDMDGGEPEGGESGGEDGGVLSLPASITSTSLSSLGS